MMSTQMCKDALSEQCIKAISTMIEKEPYLAFHTRKTITMSFDAMTTSPGESMNSSIKNGMGVHSNSQTR